MGPTDFSSEGMMKRNRRQLILFRYFPWLIRLLLWQMGRKLKDPEKAKNDLLNVLEQLPEADRKCVNNPDTLSIFGKTQSEAFRQGSKGPYHEFMLYGKSWEFKLQDISPKMKVIMWHGELDVNVPISMAREMCKAIPNCEGRFHPNDGHYSLVFNYIEDILKTLKE